MPRHFFALRLLVTTALVSGLVACAAPLQQATMDNDLVLPVSSSHGKAPATNYGTPLAANSNDLWDTLRNSFVFPDYSDNPEVRKQIRWFLDHPEYLNHITNHASPYLYYVYQEAKRRGLPPEMALIPMIESAYNPNARNPSGATGLWQLMSAASSDYGLKRNWWYDGRRDVFASTTAALDYLAYLNNLFDGHWLLVIAAYDDGLGNVQKAIRRNAQDGLPSDFWSLRLPEETHVYIPKLLALASIIRHPELYNVKLTPIPNEPYLTQVDVGGQVSLSRAAKLAGMTTSELLQLNPGYLHWATAPTGPYKLVLPIDKVIQFKTNLAHMPPEPRVTYAHYHVQHGDTLEKVAHHFGIEIAKLKSLNKSAKHGIHPGQTLVVPSKTSETAPTQLASAQTTTEHTTTTQKTITPYKIKKGDTMSSVARKHHISVAELKKINPAYKHRATLKPGQVLQVPETIVVHNTVPTISHYTVRWGDNLSSIAHRLNVSPDKLREWNHLSATQLLQPGQRLVVQAG